MPLKKIIILSFFFLFIFFVQTIKAQLLIVEIQIAGEKADNDFIKIYNSSDNFLDISGYKLRKRTVSGNESSIRVFPQGSLIKARDYFLWANAKKDFHLEIKSDVWSKVILAKNNSIALLNPENKIIDALAWGESKNPFLKGNPFPENPEINQKLKRKKINQFYYQNTNNNANDFELDPLLKHDLQIKKELKNVISTSFSSNINNQKKEANFSKKKSQKQLAAISESFQEIQNKQIFKFLFLFLIALIIAIFSGLIILILKRKINNISD